MCELGETSPTVEYGKLRNQSPYSQFPKVETYCKICTRPFPFDPRTLGCGHTFCRACVEVLILDDEVPAISGRYATDVFCPTCAECSTVQWIIDDSSSNREEDFSLATVKYDIYRKRLVKQYRRRYWSADTSWDHFNGDDGYGRIVDKAAGDVGGRGERREVHLHAMHDWGDDIRGINHVTGGFVQCVVVSGQTGAATAGPSTTNLENETPGAMTINNSKLSQRVELQDYPKISVVQPFLDSSGDQNDGRSSRTDAYEETSLKQKLVVVNCPEEFGREIEKKQQPTDYLDRHLMTTRTSVELTTPILKYGDQLHESEQIMSRLYKWCAPIALVGFILFIGVAIVISNAIRM